MPERFIRFIEAGVVLEAVAFASSRKEGICKTLGSSVSNSFGRIALSSIASESFGVLATEAARLSAAVTILLERDLAAIDAYTGTNTVQTLQTPDLDIHVLSKLSSKL